MRTPVGYVNACARHNLSMECPEVVLLPNPEVGGGVADWPMDVRPLGFWSVFYSCLIWIEFCGLWDAPQLPVLFLGSTACARGEH